MVSSSRDRNTGETCIKDELGKMFGLVLDCGQPLIKAGHNQLGGESKGEV